MAVSESASRGTRRRGRAAPIQAVAARTAWRPRGALGSRTCWCFRSISSSSPSTLVCFSFTFSSSSSLACSSSSWRVTWRRGFTCNQSAQCPATPRRAPSARTLLCGQPREEASAAHLGEDPPPLPVPQLQVGGAVPLQDLQRAELLLLLGESPEEQKDVRKNAPIAVVTGLPKGNLSYVANGGGLQ